MGELAGKVALVTGASRGIGRGVALALARHGADVAVNYFSHRDEAQQVAGEIAALGRRAIVLAGDVADRAAVARLIDETVERLGSLDIAVANAAIERHANVLDAAWPDVLRVIEVTQFGVFHTCQFAAQQMARQARAGRPGGKIIIIGSVHAELAVAGDAAYNMAKAAVNNLAGTLAVELAPYHINVNVINPGWIDTPGERAMFGDAEVDAGGRRVPWGRLGRPAEIGELAAFLAGESADYITGAALRIDGGFVPGMQPAET